MRDQTRPWLAIANELIREPNTRKMALLLKELNQVSVESGEATPCLNGNREKCQQRNFQNRLITPAELPISLLDPF